MGMKTKMGRGKWTWYASNADDMDCNKYKMMTEEEKNEFKSDVKEEKFSGAR